MSPILSSGMGTKLQYFISPLAGGNSKNDTFSGNQLGVWEYFSNIGPSKQFQKRGLEKFQGSMDRILEPHNKEFIKKTMLTHENTFKHQVRELHRLYSVQRVLMNELTEEQEMQQSGNQTTIASTSNSQHQYQGTDNNTQGHDARTDPTTREQRSGSCSGESLNLMRIPKGFDLERPAAEEEDISITGIRSLGVGKAEAGPSNIQSMDDEDCDLDLSLSIGSGCSNTGKERKQSHHQQHQHCSRYNELKEICIVSDQDQLNNAMNSSSSGMGFNQENKRPHCLVQGLSLNRA